MLAAPYTNDNPYRLLGIGSAATQSELKQAADLADRAAEIGIAPASGLLQVFGAEMLPSCRDKVQALGADPMERTIYRMFWSFDYPPFPAFSGTLSDLLRLDMLGIPPSFRTLQLRFVIKWVEYLVKPSALDVQEVLEAFDNLCKDEEFYEFLAELLIRDGEGPDQAKSVGHQAPDVVLERLLVVFSRQVAQWWESGNVTAVTALVQTLSKTAFDERIIDKTLVDLVTACEQEAARIRTLIENYQGWTPMQPPDDIAKLERLSLIATALQGHVAAAHHWLTVVQDRVLQVARSMRERANNLTTDENDYDKAAQIFVQLQALLLPEEEAQQIRNAYAHLQNLIQARDEKIWAGLTPIRIDPMLRTINGMGGTIYGRTPFAGHPDWYFVTYYLVFAFIPIFPMRRYLVSDAHGGGRYFHRSAPLTKFSKCHLAISLVSMCLFIAYIISWGQSTMIPPDAYKFVSHRPPHTTPAKGVTSPEKPPAAPKASGE